MKKSKRLEPVRQVAKNNEAAAAREVGDSIQKKESGVDQLEKLKSYRDDYIEQFKIKGESGISASRLQEYQVFVQKIDAAIDEQMASIKVLQSTVKDRQKNFQKTHSRKKVVDKLIDKSEKLEAKVEQKKEQNESDDRVPGGAPGEDILRWRFT